MQAYLAHFVFQKGRGHSAFLFWNYKMCQISLHARLFGTLEYFSPEVCLSHKKHTMARFEIVFLSNMKTDCKLTLFLIFYDTQIQVPLMVLGKTLHKLSPHFEFTLTLDPFFHISWIPLEIFHVGLFFL